jgi:hypothetical protein
MTAVTITASGLCPVCEETVRIRRNGTLYRHQRPYDPDGPIGITYHCAGSGRTPAVTLPMTFARWLRGHVARRDARDNPVTYLAQRMFHACTRNPVKAVADVDWTTAEELHTELHREGSGRDRGCDWLCSYVQDTQIAFAEYQSLQTT